MVVLEVGVGGRLDATNIVPQPVVCGITSLGFDHMEMLGDTLPVRGLGATGALLPCYKQHLTNVQLGVLVANMQVAQRGTFLWEVFNVITLNMYISLELSGSLRLA